VPGGEGESGLGDGLASLLGVTAGHYAKGGANIMPGVPGFAGGTDVIAGVLADTKF